MAGELIAEKGRVVALPAGAANIVRDGMDGVTVGGRAVRLAGQDAPPRTAVLCFGQQAAAARKGGWLQARWHETGESTVRDFLSYGEVWEVNPYEIGARRPVTRKAFAVLLRRVAELLALAPLMSRAVIALSNGETRRVLLARALLKNPQVLVLDDPAAGLDVSQRERLKAVLLSLAAQGVAIVMTCRHGDEAPGAAVRGAKARRRHPRVCAAASVGGRPVVEIAHLDLSYGRRVLFEDFSWRVNEGEHWVLRGDNGKGKTTLLALVTGDSPMAYAADIKVFGVPRKVGVALAGVRARIGMVSPEMQAYSGAGAMALLRDALRRRPRLLLLDEPFMNMDAEEVRAAQAAVVGYLETHPRVAAILVCHREDEAPAMFDRVMSI